MSPGTRIAKMNNNFSTFWGIDISKEWLDISIGNNVTRIKQTKSDISKFINNQKLKDNSCLAVLESTGGYEVLAADCLSEAGLTVHVAHPNRVRDFAKAKGYLAKTDKLDAKVMSEYGMFIDPSKIRPLPSKLQRKLRDLSSRLSQLKDMHHQEACRVGMETCKEVSKSHKFMLKTLDKQIEKIEHEVLVIIDSDKSLARKYELLQTMKGIGPKVSLSLIAELPELGNATKKEIAALLGVAPITKDSGKQRGRAVTQNGRGSIRKLVFMGALSAIRYDKKMKEFYERLVGKGKPKKVAVVAVMRKMIVIMNVMLAKNEAYRN
jgi:transposase